MSLVKQRHLRDRRDHLIDLLDMGQTYPLQDLPLYLPAKPYLVTFDNPARIGIETSQRTVLYQLREESRLVERTPAGEAGAGIPVERPGNQARIQLLSYNIKEDKTFQVFATKFTYRFALSNSSFATELDQAQVSTALRQEFEQIGGITLHSQVTVSLEKQPLIAATADAEIEAALMSAQPTITWVLREGNDPQDGKRYLIRYLNNLLAVYEMSERAVYLHQAAEVKVGLDKTLSAWVDAWVIDPDTTIEVPFLDTIPENQPLTAARLIDYNGVVTVKIENSQEGVYYRLMNGQLDDEGKYPAEPPTDNEQVISVEDDEGSGLGKLGTGENINVTTKEITEDIDIRIQATKTFPETPNRANETVFLDVILPLRVRANPALAVGVAPTSIINFNQAPGITLDSSQISAQYSLYLHHILDREFIHGPTTDKDVISVSVPDEDDDVQVPQPPRPHPWQDNTTYAQVGTALPGTGDALLLPLEALTDDSLVIIKAEKSHQLATFDQSDSRLIPSAVQLNQAALVLVRPNPAPALRLEAVIDGNQTNGELAVLDGQPGVFYAVRPAPNDKPLGLPAYFHQLDDSDQTLNKGLEQLIIGVDFAVLRTHPAGQPTDPAHTPPASPILDTGPIAENSALHIQATKAQTRVKAAMVQTASIPALPEIRVEDPIVNYGKDTRLMIIASIERERYQPYLNGEIFKAALIGNGNDRTRRTDPLTEDTVYEIRVTRPDSDQLPLTRIVELPIIVRPNPNLPLSLSEPMINYEQPATIQLGDSRPGVGYQLLVGGNPVGEAVNGTGELLPLQSEALNDDTTFGVRATRIEHPEVFVSLTAQVSVVVRPNPDLKLSLAEDEVEVGDSTTIQLQASQVGVSYQLLALGDSSTPVGDAVVGTGQTIALPTGPLTETTSFGVRATKLSHTAAIADLLQTVTVQVVSGGGNGGGG